MRIYISDYNSHAQYINSLAWYHNGTELTSDDRVSITNNGTSLTISNMAASDAGKYEVKFNSIGSDSAICDKNILPMLENFVLYAPVKFYLQESNLPTYDPRDIILDYALPAYHDFAQSFDVDKTFMINAAAVLDVTLIDDSLYKNGVHITEGTTYNFTGSYDNIITHSLRISYTNTDDIAGHYMHFVLARVGAINRAICPGYYDNIQNSVRDMQILTFYWNISSYGK